MNRADGVVEILKSEYGIESVAGLQEALLKLGGIDISPFCRNTEEEEKAS